MKLCVFYPGRKVVNSVFFFPFFCRIRNRKFSTGTEAQQTGLARIFFGPASNCKRQQALWVHNWRHVIVFAGRRSLLFPTTTVFVSTLFVLFFVRCQESVGDRAVGRFAHTTKGFRRLSKALLSREVVFHHQNKATGGRRVSLLGAR